MFLLGHRFFFTFRFHAFSHYFVFVFFLVLQAICLTSVFRLFKFKNRQRVYNAWFSHKSTVSSLPQNDNTNERNLYARANLNFFSQIDFLLGFSKEEDLKETSGFCGILWHPCVILRKFNRLILFRIASMLMKTCVFGFNLSATYTV